MALGEATALDGALHTRRDTPSLCVGELQVTRANFHVRHTLMQLLMAPAGSSCGREGVRAAGAAVPLTDSGPGNLQNARAVAGCWFFPVWLPLL